MPTSAATSSTVIASNPFPAKQAVDGADDRVLAHLEYLLAE